MPLVQCFFCHVVTVPLSSIAASGQDLEFQCRAIIL
jgi:hypothetical protein